ncbi:MAG: hypothetical protein ABGZ35_25180 [Planctomycetaceae bacterium]
MPLALPNSVRDLVFRKLGEGLAERVVCWVHGGREQLPGGYVYSACGGSENAMLGDTEKVERFPSTFTVWDVA